MFGSNTWLYDFIYDYLNDKMIYQDAEQLGDLAYRIERHIICCEGDMENEIRHLIIGAIDWYLENY